MAAEHTYLELIVTNNPAAGEDLSRSDDIGTFQTLFGVHGRADSSIQNGDLISMSTGQTPNAADKAFVYTGKGGWHAENLITIWQYNSPSGDEVHLILLTVALLEDAFQHERLSAGI